MLNKIYIETEFNPQKTVFHPILFTCPKQSLKNTYEILLYTVTVFVPVYLVLQCQQHALLIKSDF